MFLSLVGGLNGTKMFDLCMFGLSMLWLFSFS